MYDNEKLLDEMTKESIKEISNNISETITDSFIKFYENLKYMNEMLEIEKIKSNNNINTSDSLMYIRNHDFEDDKYTIKNNLKNLIKESGIKQKSLCTATGINRGTMSNLINNPESASLINVLKVCKVLGVEVEDLFKLQRKVEKVDSKEIEKYINHIKLIAQNDSNNEKYKNYEDKIKTLYYIMNKHYNPNND